MLKRLFQALVNYGAKPNATEVEARHHRFVSHGLLLNLAFLCLALLLIHIFIWYMEAKEHISYAHYRTPLFSLCFAFIAANLIFYSLRRFVRLQSFIIAAAAFAFILFPFFLSLLIGFDTGLFYYVLAFLPIGFLAFPNHIFRASIVLAFNVAFLVAMRALALKWKPHFPAPEYIKIELNAIIVVLSILLFGIQILYLGFLTQVFQRIHDVWMHYAKAGAEKYIDEKERRNHVISNQIIMVFTIALIVVAVVQAVLVIILLIRHVETYLFYFLFYLVPTLICISLFLQIFRLKAKSNTNTRFETIIFVAGNIYTLYLSFIQGHEIGLHYVFLPLILVPAFFSVASVRFKYAMALLPTAFFALCFFTLQDGWRPLPPDMTSFAGEILVFSNIGLFIVTLIYIWIKSELKERFFALWRRWSLRGTHFFESEIDKKYRIMQNQLLLVFIVLTSFMIFNEVKILFSLSKLGFNDTTGFIFHYLVPTSFSLLLLTACFYANKFTRTLTPISVAYLWGILLLGYVGISVQADSFFYIFALALLPLPFIALSGKTPWEKMILGLGLFSISFIILFSHWFLQRYSPLFPLPDNAIVSQLGFVVLATLIATFIVYFFYTTAQARLSESEIETERHKSDQLLLNILPADIVRELKDKGSTEPILFQSATVFFTDFVGFTKIAEAMTPQKLVGELDRCFTYFDKVCERYKLEKLKTIGDSFMAAGGIPIPNNTHAIDCCLAAMEIRDFMDQMRFIKKKQNQPYWQLRIGINTGNLVAGVVGEKKFAYDVWGDTVNTASRMESAGIAGEINISEATYLQVKKFFVCETRGKILAKNKGKITMYFLRSIKPEYSVDGKGRIPNEKFKKILTPA
ncbi:MAG: hypothetical protein LDLANPLL_02811 [Turneriella sp.]|nr:hypothetical protein [Turneriella sp.]